MAWFFHRPCRRSYDYIKKRVMLDSTRHIKIGTVSLPASRRCVQDKQVNILLTVVPVNPHTGTVATFYTVKVWLQPTGIRRICSKSLPKFNQLFSGPLHLPIQQTGKQTRVVKTLPHQSVPPVIITSKRGTCYMYHTFVFTTVFLYW